MSRSDFWPQVDVEYEGNWLDEDTVLEKTPNSSLTGSISYNLFSGFKDRYSALSASMLKEARENELKSIIQNVKYRIALGYLKIYQARSLLHVSENEVALLEKRFEEDRSPFMICR